MRAEIDDINIKRIDYLITLRHSYFDGMADYLGILVGKIFFARLIYKNILLPLANKGDYDIRNSRLADMSRRLDFDMKEDISHMDFVGVFPMSSTSVHKYFINILHDIGVSFLEDELLSLVEEVEEALSFDRRAVASFSGDINDFAVKNGYESVCTPVPCDGARVDPFLYRADDKLISRGDKELLVVTSNCMICGNFDGIIRVHKTIYSFFHHLLLICRREDADRYISPLVKQSPFVGLIEEALYTDEAAMFVVCPWKDRYLLCEDGRCEVPNEFITFRSSVSLKYNICSKRIEDRYCFSLNIADYDSFGDIPTEDISLDSVPSDREGKLNAVLAAVNEDGRIELKYFQNWRKAKEWAYKPVAVISVPLFDKKDYEKNIIGVVSNLPLLTACNWETVSYWIRRLTLPSRPAVATKEAAYEFLCSCIDKMFKDAKTTLKDDLCKYVTATSMASAIMEVENNCDKKVMDEIKEWLRSHRRPDGRQLSLKSPVFSLCILASGSKLYEHQISSAKKRMRGRS